MRNKCLRIFICCFAVVALLIGAVPVSADQESATVGEVKSLIDGILAYRMNEAGCDTIQQYIDGYITENAGDTEWYTIALSQYGDYDFSAYKAALESYLSTATVGAAASRQKYALALIAAGDTESEYIRATLNDSIGKQGIMSFVYGLHLLNNGGISEGYTTDAVKTEILALQLDDGGWAVMGKNGDVDTTAMAVQALAPYYNDDSNVRSAVDRALALLSERQLSSGDYSSYGVANPESTAQVLVALSSLGIDCATDSRFIKGGNTLVDGLRLYALSDGSFCHKRGDVSNESSTVQAFYSLISYYRLQNGKQGLYILDAKKSNVDMPTESEGASSGDFKDAPQSEKSEDSRSLGYKLWVSLAMACIAVGLIIALRLKKKMSAKNLTVIAILAIAAILAMIFTDFQSVGDRFGSDGGKKENVVGTVTVTVRCDTIPDKSATHIPDDGMVLDTDEIEIESGDTVYDVLSEAADRNGLLIDASKSGKNVYVKGIANIYELDFGDLSGWMYFVNGTAPSVSAGEYEVSDGDKIEWLYSCNLGTDLQ